jgi:hypothetical protein
VIAVGDFRLKVKGKRLKVQGMEVGINFSILNLELFPPKAGFSKNF